MRKTCCDAWWIFVATVVIPLIVAALAIHLFLQQLPEREFDELKLVKRVWCVIILVVVLMLAITVWEIR